MNLQIVGCSHHETGVELRERLAFNPNQTNEFLRHFYEAFPRTEAVLLSTCNRTELFTAGLQADWIPGADELSAFLARHCEVPQSLVIDSLFEHQNRGAVRHLFSVTSSLDSMVLGETQILGQVKQAYRLAVDLNQEMPVTHRAFQAAIRVARRIANETDIQANRLSIPSIAIGVFAKQIFERLDNKRILVIGAGEMAAETLTYVRECGGSDIVVVNRTGESANRLIDLFGGRYSEWENLATELGEADLVISTTSSDQPVVTLEKYHQVERIRQQRPLFILDLAIPRDFEQAIGDCLNVYLYSIDDLKAECERNRKSRNSEWPKAQKIVDQETELFMSELLHHSKGPTIQRLKQQAHEIKEAEIQRLLNKLGDLDPQHRSEIEAAFHRVVNKLLHPPLESLRDESEEGSNGLLDALKRLFKLED